MSNGHYQKGYRLENAVVRHLRGLGYEASRAYASKGAFGEDVTAWHPSGQAFLIQCKSFEGGKGMMRPAEWNRFISLAPKGFTLILANGTPTHIRYYRITGPRKEGLTGWNAKRDIEENMTEHVFEKVLEVKNDEYFG